MRKESLMCKIGHLKYKIVNNFDEKYISKIRNKNLKNKNFTIISNNCWGGWVYRRFGLAYLSPTIGLFIMPKDYLKFINNLKYYLFECDLSFIDPQCSRYKDTLQKNPLFGKYPIGKLDDIEICFLHYKDEKEAKEKWNRRTSRVNLDNLIIKFCDQNGCTNHDIEEFNKIDKFKKMLCFTSKKIPGKYNIYMWEFKKDGYVIDDKYWCPQHINLKKIIESK